MLAFYKWDKNDFQPFGAQYLQSWIPDEDTSWLATYNIYINPAIGVITIPYVQSPKQPYVKPGDPPPNPDLPLLTKLSDFVWLAYKQACGTDTQCLGRLEWVVHHQITHTVSKAVIQKVTGMKKNYPGFPGISHETTKDKGRALVGCPNGMKTSKFDFSRLTCPGRLWSRLYAGTAFQDGAGCQNNRQSLCVY